MERSRLFIGSASKSSAVVRAIEYELRNDANISTWDVSTFRLSQTALQELERKAHDSDFAVFVLGPDDETVSRGEITPSPRDNVIFEAGVFSGIIGIPHTFYVVDPKGTKMPSDWDGLGYATYDSSRKPDYSVAKACIEIRHRMRELGARRLLDIEAAISGKWWQFVLNHDDGSVLALLEIVPGTASRGLIVTGQSWSKDAQHKANTLVIPIAGSANL